MKNDAANTVPALEKALDILDYVAQRGTAVSIKEIAADLSIAPATAYRTVKTLCNRKYLRESSQGDGGYNLGPQLLYLAHLITKQVNLIVEAEQAMRNLAAKSGQTAQLGILQDFGVMYIEQRQPTKPVNIIAALRTVIPVNVSASGKVLVAYLPAREQEYFLEHAALPAQTANTITEINAFKEELARVRRSGYAQDREEYARGIGCLAAPIWDHQERVVAAIGITGHIADYTNESQLEKLILLVKEAAAEISQNLGALGVSQTITDFV